MDDIVSIQLTRPYSFEDDLLPESIDQVNVEIQASFISNAETIISMEQENNIEECCFFSNLLYWNNEKSFRSVNNFESSHFDAIVKMGKRAIPFIYQELQKGPTPLVFALDRIFEGEVNYEGYVPLDFVCNVWLDILRQKKMQSQISF